MSALLARWRRLSLAALLAGVLPAGLGAQADFPDVAQPRVVRDFHDRVMYFVLTDRFDNGQTGNDRGGLSGTASTHGFDRASANHYHGGDLAGLRNRLDYLAGLGVNAIWTTPPLRNKPVQFGNVASYHGYWITDFLNIDPHLGTRTEYDTLVSDMRNRGMAMFMDIVINHTADVFYHSNNIYTYVPTSTTPYRDASGNIFRLPDVVFTGANASAFPTLSAQTFPYTIITQTSPDERNLRNPAWLNDFRNYHHRGNSTFDGESSHLGDFSGLDDLFTEKPEVVQGMIDIYGSWAANSGIAGFRIDTVKHVNSEFWRQWAPAVRAQARAAGKPDFYMFGEVFNGDPTFLGRFSTQLGLDSTLDFSFQSVARSFVSQTQSSSGIYDLLSRDDEYNGPGLHATAQPVFLGNHDMGRFGYFLRQDNGGANDQTLQDLSKLGHALMYFLRGQPVIYYGDEQGFVGGGADTNAREDMRNSQVQAHASFDLIGTGQNVFSDNFQTGHPLYRALAAMSQVYSGNVALRRGAVIARPSGNSNVAAWSRLDRTELVEYVVAINNHRGNAQTVTLDTLQPSGVNFTLLFNSRLAGSTQQTGSATTTANGKLTLSVPALSLVIYRAGAPLAAETGSLGVTLTSQVDDGVAGLRGTEIQGLRFPGRVLLTASTTGTNHAEVTFAYERSSRPAEIVTLGTDDNAPYQVYFTPPTDLSANESVNFYVSANDLRGRKAHHGARRIRLVEGEGFKYFVVHYFRADGNYDAWRLQTQPVGSETATLAPFVGETSYGRFAFLPLGNPNQALRVNLVPAAGGTGEWPSPYTLLPGQRPQVWVRSGDVRLFGSASAARGSLRLHYRRTAGDTTGWVVDVFATETGGSAFVTGRAATSSTTFGATFEIAASDLPAGVTWRSPLWVTVRNGATNEGEPRRRVDPWQTGDYWLAQGGAWQTSRSAAEGVALLHFRRADGQYGNTASSNFNDFWGLHVWTGAASPNPAWTTPLKPTSTPSWGQAYRVALSTGATQLFHIWHRGEAKDPSTDLVLDVNVSGHEVWQFEGADAAFPYVVHSGPRPYTGVVPTATDALSTARARPEAGNRLRFRSTVGVLYQLEAATSPNGPWTAEGAPMGGTGDEMTVDLPTATPVRFFRLAVRE